LQRAFKMAGVNNLIMSLWKVDDNATQKFMNQFYTFLFRDKLKVYDAFIKAQILMKDTYTQPYYWAGFVLME
jgi:CHAT domain-containing protein